MNEQEIADLEGGLAKLDLKLNALNAARDSIREKLNAAKAGKPPKENSSGVTMEILGGGAAHEEPQTIVIGGATP